MSVARLVASRGPGELRVALLVDGRLVEVWHQRGEREVGPGAILVGRVRRVTPSLAGAFVDIGEAREGFLNLAAGEPVPEEGATVIVAIERAAEGEKGARLSRRPQLVGRRLVFCPEGAGVGVPPGFADRGERARLRALLAPLLEPGEGVLARPRAAGADAPALAAELARLRAAWHALRERAAALSPPALLAAAPSALARALDRADGPDLAEIVVDDPALAAEARAWYADGDRGPRIAMHRGGGLFAAYGLEEAILAALEPRVALPSGGTLTIEETEALIAIDVDLARAEGTESEALRRRVAEEAAVAVAHELRLRRLGGIVAVDFPRLGGAAPRRRLLEAFRRALAVDEAVTPPKGYAEAGLVVFTRRREGPSLAEVLCGPRVIARRPLSAETVALAIARRLAEGPAAHAVVAAPEVIAALEGGGLLAALAERGQRPRLTAEATRAREDFIIVAR